MKNTELSPAQELKTLSPFLANLPKPTMESVPDGYFDIIEDQVTSLVNIAAYDSTIEAEKPNGYFESFENNIIPKIHEQTVDIRKKHLTLIRIIMKIAAAFVFILVSYLTILQFDTYSLVTTSDDLTLQDEENWDYLMDNSDDITLNMLIDNGLVEVSDLDVNTNHIDN